MSCFTSLEQYIYQYRIVHLGDTLSNLSDSSARKPCYTSSCFREFPDCACFPGLHAIVFVRCFRKRWFVFSCVKNGNDWIVCVRNLNISHESQENYWNYKFKALSIYCLRTRAIYRVSQKNPNYWNHVLLEFECPSTKLNAKMRKILTY